jgi:hypothetical protein
MKAQKSQAPVLDELCPGSPEKGEHMKAAFKLWMGILLFQAGFFLTGPGIAQTFEGSVVYQMTADRGTSTLEYIRKGQKLRTNINTGESTVSSIIDMDAKTITTLMPENKSYMVMSIPDIKNNPVTILGAKEYKDTGNSETILGYHCEEWAYTSDKGSAHVWLAKGLGVFDSLKHDRGKSMDDWVYLAKLKGMFPLKASYRDRNGKEVSAMVATQVSKKPVASGVFEIPADYTEMKMPGMNLGQMGSGISGFKLPGQ